MVLVLGIVKASLKILGIGIGVKKVVLLMSGTGPNDPNEFGSMKTMAFSTNAHSRFESVLLDTVM